MAQPPSASNAPPGAAPSTSASTTKPTPHFDMPAMPAPSNVKTAASEVEVPPAAPPPPPVVEGEQVVAPDPRTLAHGKWETKPLVIWLLVGVALFFLAVHVVLRVRRLTRARRDLEARLRSPLPRDASRRSV